MKAHSRSRIALALGIACAAVASPPETALARPPGGLGSAIAPVFSLQPEAMQPGEDTALLACVVNENPASARHPERGDAFSFTFLDGRLGACTEVQGIGDLEGSDLACEVEGSTLRLRFVADEPSWPPGDGACAIVGYAAPERSTIARTGLDVANRGAYAAPEPPAVLLSVAAGIGTEGPPGPQGPQGPTGPAGPPGPSGLGAVAAAEATSSISVGACELPRVVPGLELTLEVAAGSRLLLLLDAVAYQGCLGNVNLSPGLLHVQLDREYEASRLPYSATAHTTSHITDEASHQSVLTEPLIAGPHEVRVLLEWGGNALAPCTVRTLCVGEPTDLSRQSRLTAIELRP